MKNGGIVKDSGVYYPLQLPDLLNDKKYHWHMNYYKKSTYFEPRLEVAMVEAFNEGCLPIVCKETTPEWVGESSALRFSKFNYRERSYILASMSDEERLSRLKNFYHLLRQYVYEGPYIELKHMIQKYV